MSLVALICLVAVCCSPVLGAVLEDPNLAAYTLFVTGCQLGSLRPCGCAGGQLGGLERLPGIFHQLPSERRFLLDIGWWTRTQAQQDLLKVQTLFRGLQLIGYDLVHLTGHDVQMAMSAGLIPVTDGPRLITDQPIPQIGLQDRFEQSVLTGVGPVLVHAESVRLDQLGSRLETLEPATGVGLQLDVFIADRSGPIDIGHPGQRRLICVILPATSDQPMILSDGNPSIISMGRYGRYVVRLDLFVGDSGPRLVPSVIAVSEQLTSHPELMDLYHQYQQMVAASGLLNTYPRVPLPKGLRYVGSQACQRCHRYEYEKASQQPHASAYATLEKVGSHMDPECVVCHVVGLGYEGGYLSIDRTPELKDVGCEVCHGPGSEHIRTVGRARTTGPRLSCLDCHTPDHSPEYGDHTSEYLRKIEHWKEPVRSIIVKTR